MVDKKVKQVTVEFYPRDIRGAGYHEIMDGIEKVTVLSPISLMPERSALLIIVKGSKKDDLTFWEDNELIDKVIDMGVVKDGKMYLILGKEEPWFFKKIQMIMEEMKVFFNWPVILEPDRIQIRWMGYLEDISKVMKLFEVFEMKETITSIVDYDPLDERFGNLTDKQYEFLMEAYEKGYFNDRRKVTINDLAKERGISAPSYMITLRRAMRNLIRGSID